MKRTGYLYDKIYDWDNLLLAYHKASRGKHGEAAEEYNYCWEQYLFQAQQSLSEGSYRFGDYRQFTIHEPKERVITSAPFRDRVVHHAICNILGPVLDKPLIVDSYACRKGKGLHRAVKKAFYWYKQSSHHYRLDISKYYYTIDHAILMDLIRRKIKDKRLLSLLGGLLATYDSGLQYYDPLPDDDLLAMIRPRGLPIGNLSSQLFANFYLSGVDHFVREQLHLVRYVRYMDDILVFGDDRQELERSRVEILQALSRLRLKPNPRKDYIKDNKEGVDFLGFRLTGNTIRIRSQNLARFRRKMKAKSKSGPIELAVLLRSFNGHLGYLKGGHTKKICNEVLESIQFHDATKNWKLVV